MAHVDYVRQRLIFTVALEQEGIASEDRVAHIIIDEALVELVFHNHLPHRDRTVLTGDSEHLNASDVNIGDAAASLKF